eukprot:CAMPEP_0116896534 /NCGR_PEP_ID=MMETSP0467-20121206/5753_1 /TAXON_ID=283647 /ORGANISM="Mesodinium pulex, Strain SPMC105" /LENGTH=34 /DNA_ID= /DNA_START= /DNA_END= /DNA_ORIENTATION=
MDDFRIKDFDPKKTFLKNLIDEMKDKIQAKTDIN